jgi:hypothetical protein
MIKSKDFKSNTSYWGTSQNCQSGQLMLRSRYKLSTSQIQPTALLLQPAYYCYPEFSITMTFYISKGVHYSLPERIHPPTKIFIHSFIDNSRIHYWYRTNA